MTPGKSVKRCLHRPEAVYVADTNVTSRRDIIIYDGIDSPTVRRA